MIDTITPISNVTLNGTAIPLASSGAELKEEVFTSKTPAEIFALLNGLVADGKIIYGISYDADWGANNGTKLDIDSAGAITRGTAYAQIANPDEINIIRNYKYNNVYVFMSNGNVTGGYAFGTSFIIYGITDCRAIVRDLIVEDIPSASSTFSWRVYNRAITSSRSGKIYYI